MLFYFLTVLQFAHLREVAVLDEDHVRQARHLGRQPHVHPVSRTGLVQMGTLDPADQHVGRADYQHLIPTMPGTDPDDHVHAAAAASIAPSIILTSNTKDFPAMDLAALGVTVIHPDAYFHELLDAVPNEIHAVLAEMSRSRRRPPMSVLEVVGVLERAGLQAFARRIRGAP